jgi:hypothetical protein
MWGTSLLRNASSRSLAEGAKPVPEQPAGPESPTQRRSSVGRRSTRRAGLTPSALWGRSGCGWLTGSSGRCAASSRYRSLACEAIAPSGHNMAICRRKAGYRSPGSRSSIPQFATDSRGFWPQNSALANCGGIVGTASETVARGSPATCSGRPPPPVVALRCIAAALRLTFVGVSCCCGRRGWCRSFTFARALASRPRPLAADGVDARAQA